MVESPETVICLVDRLDCLYGITPPPNENVLLLSSAGAVCGGLTMLTSISGNCRGSVTEAGARSRLRLVLGLMIGFEIPEFSFSSASSGFSLIV